VKRLLACLLLVLLLPLASVLAKDAEPLAEDPVIERRLVDISDEMRCLVCQNESLSGSRAELAQDLRRELRTLIRQGRSDEEIREFMVSRYGDFVLYRPRMKPATWLLWAGPFVLMVAGVAVLFVYLRRRNRELRGADLSEEEARRADELLRGGST
jgi:cytochrome c-type biogenesis protein CcmH